MGSMRFEKPSIININYTLVEESPTGFVIGNLLKDSHIEELYRPDIWKKISFIRFHLHNPDKFGFVVDNKTGILKTGKIIDREQVCYTKMTCLAKLSVSMVATFLRYADIREWLIVLVNIEDINDNFPQFPLPKMSLHIRENTPIGTKYLLPSADDLDSNSKYQVKGYEIGPKEMPFSLEVTKNTEFTIVELILEELLDYEKMNFYAITLKAFDGDLPSKVTAISVYITVQNVNDNKPIFDNDTYTVDIPENTVSNLTIVQINALDKDNAKLTYMFSKQTKNKYGHVFQLNNTTGEISIIGVLDFEDISVYHLSVTASDGMYKALGRVIIHVLDVNDNSPTMQFNGIPLYKHINNIWLIPEDSPVGSLLIYFTVTDSDSGLNGICTCSLKTKNNDFELMYVETLEEYRIYINAQLDREILSHYALEILCIDKGTIPLSSLTHIEIELLDINDNPPVFIRESYLFNLQENNYIGQYVGQVMAIDKDSGPNADIYYELENSAEMFIIDNTGIIRTNVVFDREKGDQYFITVIAFDRGVPCKSGSVLINLHINDLDDEYPDFGQSAYYFWISAQSPVSTLVGRVFATDSDEIPHNVIRYHLNPYGVGSDKFIIDSQTGNITTTSTFDINVQSVFTEVIVAMDSGIPPFETLINVTIFIMPENDRSLVFIHPSLKNNTIVISNKVHPGVTLLQVAVTYINNSNLFYELIAGNDLISSLFKIDHITGEVSVSQPLHKIQFDIYQLLIRVTDSKMPNKFNTANLNIVINGSLHFPYRRPFSNHSQFKPILIGVLTAALLIIIITIIIPAIIIYKKKQETNFYNCKEATLNNRLKFILSNSNQ